MSKVIILKKTEKGIVSCFLKSGKPDPEIISLFGTHVLPTAFTDQKSLHEARKEIKELNPDYYVITEGKEN